LDIKLLRKVTKILQNPYHRNISGKFCVFTCNSSGKEVYYVSGQYFLKNIATLLQFENPYYILVSLVTSHAAVLEKKSEMFLPILS
jgi:hypothetical protein